MQLLEQTHSIRTPQALRLVRAQSRSTQAAPEVYNAMLHALLAAKILFEANEVVQGSTAYRHELKALLKKLQPLLAKMLDQDYSELIQSDVIARITFRVEREYTEFLECLTPHRLLQHTPSELAGLGELINAFHRAPLEVLERNGIKIEEEVV